MKRTLLLLSVFIFLVAALCATLSACSFFSTKKEEEPSTEYSEWAQNRDGTHSRYLLSDPETIETEECTITTKVVSATCSNEGYVLHRCEKCKYSYRTDVTPIDPDAHAIVHHEAKLPSCTAEGWDAYDTCSLCSYTTYDHPIAATGHTFGEWEYDSPMKHSRVCLNCSVRGYADHATVEDAAVVATCTQTGLTAGSHCTICNHSVITQKEIPIDSDKHDNVQIDYSEATCTESGSITYLCRRCEQINSTPIPPLGHQLSEEIYPAEDYHYNLCLRCNTEHNKVTHLPEVIPMVEPTCTDDGLSEGSRCSVCLHILQAQSVLPSDHTSHSTVYHPAVEASCTQKGNYEFYTCSRCSYTTYKEISPLGHDYRATEIIPATCISYEKQRYVCNRCNSDYLQTIGNVHVDHLYDGHVCRYCLRDEYYEHSEDFLSHGNTTDDLLAFSDTHTLALFFDYLFSDWVTDYKYFSYTGATTSNYHEIFQEAMHQLTAQNWTYECSYSYSSLDSSIAYFRICCAHTGDRSSETICSLTPLMGTYPLSAREQQDFLTIGTINDARGESYTAFPYLSRTHTKEVTTSDQLFYAFSHGYLPLPKAGSSAERILNAAKAVNREIISDDMSDALKIYAIMQWIVKQVTYDYGAFDASESGSFDAWKYTSWYAEGVFDYQLSVCDGISKAVCILAGLEDILCIRVVDSDHAWNRVYLDAGTGEKCWYVLDATHANASVNASYEILVLSQYLITDAQKSSYGHTAINYAGTAAAVTSINPFALLHFGSAEANEGNDLVINSDEDFLALFTYVLAERQSSTTDLFSFECFLPLSYCANESGAMEKLQAQMKALGFYGSFSHSFTNMTFAGESGLRAAIYLNK